MILRSRRYHVRKLHTCVDRSVMFDVEFMQNLWCYYSRVYTANKSGLAMIAANLKL